MLPRTHSPDDTIAAIATAPGPGARSLIRLSGPGLPTLLRAALPGLPTNLPRFIRRSLTLKSLASAIPVDVYISLAPRSYTGEHTAELHLPGSPPLVDAVLAHLLNGGARPALPGEFTQRAFLAGKRDLTRSEAVFAVIHANSDDELKRALVQLAGGVSLPLQEVREDLLNLLADVEAGLDFTEEDIHFIDKSATLLRLGKALALLMNLRRQLEDRGISGEAFRAVLAGEPNAGKSSLFNALAGKRAALVSPEAGTTRDYLKRTVTIDELAIELIDTAGRQTATTGIETQAQTLGKRTADGAHLILWCLDCTQPVPHAEFAAGVEVVRVYTKSDLRPDFRADSLVSSTTGTGIAELKTLLRSKAEGFAGSALAPSLSRCRHLVDRGLTHLRSGHSVVLFDQPMELFALELRLALEAIGEMTGAVYTDDLLDRIFSRFCIGK